MHIWDTVSISRCSLVLYCSLQIPVLVVVAREMNGLISGHREMEKSNFFGRCRHFRVSRDLSKATLSNCKDGRLSILLKSSKAFSLFHRAKTKTQERDSVQAMKDTPPKPPTNTLSMSHKFESCSRDTKPSFKIKNTQHAFPFASFQGSCHDQCLLAFLVEWQCTSSVRQYLCSRILGTELSESHFRTRYPTRL